MKITHIVLTRDDGSRQELTFEEARQLFSHLGLVFGPQLPTAPSLPVTAQARPFKYEPPRLWGTVTCSAEARQ